MHNGIHKTLEDVMDFYESIADGNNNQINQHVTNNMLDENMLDLDLDEEQIGSIIAFLKALNDTDFDKQIPSSVPSGLPVGGNIY